MCGSGWQTDGMTPWGWEAEVGPIGLEQASGNTRPTRGVTDEDGATGPRFQQTYGSHPTREQAKLIEQYENFDMLLYDKAVEIFEARLSKLTQ